MTVRQRKSEPIGAAKPRLAPPTPARSDVDGLREVAAELGITLMPWQETAARYLTAKGPDGHLYREVCVVVGRQNGKTTLMKPLIVKALREGKRVMHIAQTRELPRQMFGLIAASLDEKLFMKRRGKGGKMQTIWPRHGSGQEEILLANGGSYRIAASSNGGARGWSNDLVIIDELREMDDVQAMDAIEPTLTMSEDPQIVYLSNAGSDRSVVLNAVRLRADADPTLAYLEWSADPQLAADDVKGWTQANPAIGHFRAVITSVETAYRRAKLSGMMAGFETERLCRWVSTLRERLVDDYSWVRCASDEIGAPLSPSLAVSMDPKGRRASVALAWQQDETIALRLLYNVTGDPIDTDALGDDIRKTATKLGVKRIGYDPVTDRELVKYLRKPKPESIGGQAFANASSQFVNIVNANKLRHMGCDPVTDDLTWTSRKLDNESGSYQAVRAQDDRPITASLAAIRAVWLASGPKPAIPRVM